MCRYNDVGPYSVENTYIATNSQNTKDQFKEKDMTDKQLQEELL